MAIRKTKGSKLRILVDQTGLPLVCTIFPANMHDSQMYKPTLEAFTIPKVTERQTIISADAAYDAREIR
ncbi:MULTISPECIES: transposase [unclassified Methanoculleus]|jgi:transposase|uniref:transposase n=1 Tax=unclassified Methanoculleus TaxID=2619537 RepID=UPI00319E15F8